MACGGLLGLCFGTVIYIESVTNSGNWLGASEENVLYFSPAKHEELVVEGNGNNAAPQSKWILRDGWNGHIWLESMQYCRHYLSSDSVTLMATISPTPINQTQTKWIMTKEGGYYYFESAYEPQTYLKSDQSSSGKVIAYKSPGKSYASRMRIYQPSILEIEEPIFDFDNTNADTDYYATGQVTYGVGASPTIAHLLTTADQNIKLELQARLSINGTFSAVWKEDMIATSEKTWKSETVMEQNFVIPSGHHVTYSQLVAYYGIDEANGPYFQVHSARVSAIKKESDKLL